MQFVKFSITVTSPFVITADGDFSKELFAGDFTTSLPSKNIQMSTRRVSSKDNPKFGQLKGDQFGTEFQFFAPERAIHALCKNIATEILQHESFSPDLRILVDGSKNSSVIGLSGIGGAELAKTISQIVTNR